MVIYVMPESVLVGKVKGQIQQWGDTTGSKCRQLCGTKQKQDHASVSNVEGDSWSEQAH